MIYEVNISYEVDLKDQSEVNKHIKSMTDKIIPDETGYVGRFQISVVDTTDDEDDDEDF